MNFSTLDIFAPSKTAFLSLSVLLEGTWPIIDSFFISFFKWYNSLRLFCQEVLTHSGLVLEYLFIKGNILRHFIITIFAGGDMGKLDNKVAVITGPRAADAAGNFFAGGRQVNAGRS